MRARDLRDGDASHDLSGRSLSTAGCGCPFSIWFFHALIQHTAKLRRNTHQSCMLGLPLGLQLGGAG